MGALYPSSQRVLIAGAGIGGLTAALALLKAGFDCDVYEQAPELKEVGAGLQLAPNGSRVLLALGLESNIRAYGVETDDKVVRLWNTGQSWSRYNPKSSSISSRLGAPMYLMHRADLHTLLAEAVLREKPGSIHLSARCVGFTQTGLSASIRLADGTQENGDVLIGADGIHSRIREELFGPAVPKFTGFMAWRGLAPMERLPAHLRRPISTQWLGPKSHVTCYPVHKGKLLNMVAEVERSDWRLESWVEPGSQEECLADFSGFHCDLTEIIKRTDALYKWAIYLREPLQRWTVGRVTLLGDACHAMLPFLGQGANTAIEDGFILARCLVEHRDNLAVGLERYERARRNRANEIMNRSAQMVDLFYNDALGDPQRAPAYVEANWTSGNNMNRYRGIHDFDATSVAI